MSPDQQESEEGPPQPRSNVTRAASVIGMAVLASRVLGLVREQVFAAFFGAGAVFDAFVTAFRIPNLFRDLLAEGALSAAFVKVFSQTLDREGEKRAWRLASVVFTVLAALVSLLVLAGILAAPWIVHAMAPGFDEGQKILATRLTRVMFPFLLLVSLAAVVMGVLNSTNRFGIPALAGAFFNVGSLVFGLLAAALMEPEYMLGTARAAFAGESFQGGADAAAGAILGMAIGVLAGGALQLLLQTPSLHRTGFRFRPGFDLKDPGLRQVFRLMGPAVIGTAAVQVNVFVNNNFASRLEHGAVSWLSYAFRFMQFPIGIFGVAIATATLPAIARAIARKDEKNYRETLSSSLRLALFLTLPSAAGLIVLGRPIVGLIYERGNFLPADTEQTAAALTCFAVGLVGYALVKILAPAFYAVDDPKTPARISLFSILLNLLLCTVLVGPLGHRGLALSTASVATLNALALWLLLRRRVGSLGEAALLGALIRIGLATVALWFTCRYALAFLEGWLPGTSLGPRLVHVFGAISMGGGVYLLVHRLLPNIRTR
ncbi:MAG: murein biosynthesis integral membrane protein MurJ [Planctomycetota bacterium]